MASDRILGILGSLLGDQLFKEKEVPVIEKSRYMTNGQASINPVQEFVYDKNDRTDTGSQYGTPMNGVLFAPEAQQYSDRDIMRDPVRLSTAPMSRDLEKDTMEQTIVDRNQDVAGFAPLTPQENIPAQTEAESNVDKLINSDFASNMADYENQNLSDKLETNFFDHVKDFFGDEKTMLMLALGFNSMRLNPDATLATAIGKRLETLQDFASKDEVYDEIMSYAMKPGTSTAERNRLLAIANILKKGGLTPKEASTQAFKRDINKYNDAFQTAAAPKVMERLTAEIDTVKGAEQSLAKNEMVLNILGDPEQERANVGIFSGIRQTLDRAFSFFGSDEARKRASETEALQAFLGSDVFPMIKQLGIGARGLDTPAERKFLQEVMTGNIEQTPQTLRILTEYRRKLNTKIIDAYNQKVADGYFKRYDSLFSTEGFDYQSKPIEYNKDYKYRFLPQVEGILKNTPKQQTKPSNAKIPADLNGDGVVDANEWKQYNQRK